MTRELRMTRQGGAFASSGLRLLAFARFAGIKEQFCMSQSLPILKALKTRFWDQQPFILSHLLTARCNADCRSCLWKRPADSREDELSTEGVRQLYRDAAAAGFRSLVLWGGEPLLRQDAGELLRFAAEVGLDSTLITNGWWLAERHADVLPHISRLILSVDALDSQHDQIRRCPGLFRRLEAGLEMTRKLYPRVKILLICVLSRLNREAPEPLAHFAKRYGVSLLFQQMNLEDYGFADRATDASDIALSPEESQMLSAKILELRRGGARVRDSNGYLRRIGETSFTYRCHYKKVLLRVEPNGDLLDCTQNAKPMANLRTARLRDVLASERYRQFIKVAEQCHRCRDVGVIELSHIWEGRPEAILNAIRELGR
ncbi:MAG TPA: radical SAM protein [Polyangiaceae bacterium]